jgi:spoIIIJ-associated protein
MSPAAQSAKQHLEDLLTFFGVNTTVQVSENGETIELMVDTDDGGHLIGHRGETLAAIQHLMNMIMRQESEERLYIHVDIGGYRRARLDKLEAQARELAQQVILPPMNPAERRHIHSLLSDNESVTTESRGEGTGRRLVIKKR